MHVFGMHMHVWTGQLSLMFKVIVQIDTCFFEDLWSEREKDKEKKELVVVFGHV